ncbi:hypothetical protein CIPAW_08G116700 [Carya illinoinensis]|uniref:Uncharacterized protein n=1 Tax=Carya illinoinensis TaxID=32201 RepID=A0A8T1PQQ5_CARIL|nr:hypothetical protein CIPAW_08G116700 [Carya illinoinensis]
MPRMRPSNSINFLDGGQGLLSDKKESCISVTCCHHVFHTYALAFGLRFLQNSYSFEASCI